MLYATLQNKKFLLFSFQIVDIQYDIDPFDDIYQDYFDSAAATDSTVHDSVTKWVASKTEDERFELGHQMENLIMQCTYSKYPCQTNKYVAFLGSILIQFLGSM